VLLVEDNPVNRQVAQRLLTLTGLTLDCAENGKEAIDLLQKGAYDAVLMDCQMPVMDGYSATRERRAIESAGRLQRIPIIAMTANAMVGDREKCLASGMDDYLSKPLNRALLEETLRRWLPATPVARAATSQAILAEAALASVTPINPPNRTARAEPAALCRVATAAVPGGNGIARPSLPARPDPVRAAPAHTPAATPAARTQPVQPVAATRAAGPALNSEIVDDLREIMGSEFLSLIKVFLEDAPLSLGKLELAASRDQIEALVAPAHSLKSTSANLGALALSEIARKIEHGARLRSLTDPRSDVADLGREFHRVEAALRGFLG
jgi:CheY-like chemotaxis protein/HPt (histidine-containing phosphotransfer) domain-containing protein